jgi:two-component sensor histidine kinase
MTRLGELDVLDRLAPLPAWVSEILVAVACVGIAVLIRLSVDLFVRGAGAFAFMYPAVMVATLFGRWRSGLFSLAFLTVFVWHFVPLATRSFTFASYRDVSVLVVNACAGLVIIFFAELFRRAVRRAVEERSTQIEARDLFLREVNHRVKNNFAVVASLLSLQRRRASDKPTKDALAVALNRVESIARAHRHLYRDGRNIDVVDMQLYLTELCQALSEALLLGGAIALKYQFGAATLARDRAVSIGLVVNELVTNAAKHAFEGRSSGIILVRFEETESGWLLAVEDNGVGIPTEGYEGGLGHRLIEAFTQQANGVLTSSANTQGARFELHLSR